MVESNVSKGIHLFLYSFHSAQCHSVDQNSCSVPQVQCYRCNVKSLGKVWKGFSEKATQNWFINNDAVRGPSSYFYLSSQNTFFQGLLHRQLTTLFIIGKKKSQNFGIFLKPETHKFDMYVPQRCILCMSFNKWLAPTNRFFFVPFLKESADSIIAK